MLILTVGMTGLWLTFGAGLTILRHQQLQQAMMDAAIAASRANRVTTATAYTVAVQAGLGTTPFRLSSYSESGSPGQYHITASGKMEVPSALGAKTADWIAERVSVS
ncbi:MAG: hypothetical protein M0Z53_14035 [Thermaerobacter sp.]|nr:hypothetical protein [Thermaerobacter sp.]